MKTTLLLTALLLTLTQCTSLPRTAIKVTNDPKDIAGCRKIGSTTFPLRGGKLYINDMKRRIFEKDANTLLVLGTSEIPDVKGPEAYSVLKQMKETGTMPKTAKYIEIAISAVGYDCAGFKLSPSLPVINPRQPDPVQSEKEK